MRIEYIEEYDYINIHKRAFVKNIGDNEYILTLYPLGYYKLFYTYDQLAFICIKRLFPNKKLTKLYIFKTMNKYKFCME